MESQGSLILKYAALAEDNLCHVSQHKNIADQKQ